MDKTCYRKLEELKKSFVSQEPLYGGQGIVGDFVGIGLKGIRPPSSRQKGAAEFTGIILEQTDGTCSGQQTGFYFRAKAVRKGENSKKGNAKPKFGASAEG